jgi:hypothetical protein
VPAYQQADQSDRVVVEAHPGSDPARERLARHAVLGQPALADVVQQAGDQQHVGPADTADQPGGLHAGLHDVPVDGEAVDRRRVREQPDPFPLGQDRVQGTRLLQRLPHRQQPGSRGEEPDQRLTCGRGPGVGQRRALGDQAGRGRGSQLQVALRRDRGGPEQQGRVTGRPGVTGEHHLARRERDPRLHGLELRAAPAARSRQDAVDATPGQP